jgi:ABC-type sugar transport system permease subunit
MALLLNGGHAFTKFFRTVFFSSNSYLFFSCCGHIRRSADPYYGLANSFLKLLGLPGQPFFGSQDQALWCIIWLSVWRSAGLLDDVLSSRSSEYS